MPKLFMETTKIAATKTAGEISELLRMAGAQKIVQDYDKEGKLIALQFGLMTPQGLAGFKLPIRVEPVFVHLQKSVTARNRWKKAQDHLEQAERVAWRQILRWVQAQLALIETGMVDVGEVFLPYLMASANQTVYQLYAETGRLLPAPEEKTA